MDNSNVSYVALINEINEAKEAHQLGEALERLKSNADFITVFDSYLFKELVYLLVQAKGRVLSDEDHKRIDTKLLSLGVLQSLLDDITLQATNAYYTIQDCEEQLRQQD